MKNLFYICIALFMLSGCGNRNTRPIVEDRFESESHISRQLLHSTIMEEVNYWQKENKNNLPIEIFFTDSVLYTRAFRSDSVIFVSYFDKKSDFPNKYYKGILMVDSTVVAIFDRNNVGQRFYDTSKVVLIPIERINKAELGPKPVTTSVIIMKGDSLYHYVGM